MKFRNFRRHPLAFVAMTAAAAIVAACSSDLAANTGPSEPQVRYAVSVTSTTYTLSSVTPPIVCTDASGAVTTVSGGTLVLSSNGKFTATFTTSTTSGDVVTTQSYSEKGTFTQTGNTIVFKVPGAGTYSATIDNGTLTIADYPFCGATHTAVFTQV